jgi:hypothetical protein
MNYETCACKDTNCSCQKCMCGSKCISWSAILVGALIAVGLGILLNLFSVSISLTGYHMSANGAKTLAIGGLIGIAIGTFVIMFFSGWVAGFMGRSRCNKGSCGGIYGFVTWCVALLISMLLAGNVGTYIASFTNFVENPTYTSLQATSNTAAPTVTVAHNDRNQTAAVVVNPGKVAMGSFIIFILFLIGALASTWGGHCGLRSCCGKKGSCNSNCSGANVGNKPNQAPPIIT